MRVVPRPTIHSFISVEPGALFSSQIRDITRFCIKGAIPEQDNDPAAVILGPFTDDDMGVPWLYFPSESDAVLDFGTDWECKLNLLADHISISDAGNLSATGGILLGREADHLQLTNNEGSTPLFLNLATGAVANRLPAGRLITVKKWIACLSAREGGEVPNLITVTAASPRSL